MEPTEGVKQMSWRLCDGLSAAAGGLAWEQMVVVALLGEQGALSPDLQLYHDS